MGQDAPKVEPGGGITKGTKMSFLQFHCDKNGKLDLKNGKYTEEKMTQMKCKYTNEVCLCLGAAMVTPLDGNGNPLPTEWRTAKSFVYTGKVLLSITDYAKTEQ